MPFLERNLSVEVNERFIMHNEDNSLPRNIMTPRFFAESNNCKHIMVMTPVVFLTTSLGLAKESNRFVNG